jgi:hypothetical protein
MERFASNSIRGGDVPYLAAIGQGDSEEECVPGEPIAAIALQIMADHITIEKIGLQIGAIGSWCPDQVFPRISLTLHPGYAG